MWAIVRQIEFPDYLTLRSRPPANSKNRRTKHSFPLRLNAYNNLMENHIVIYDHCQISILWSTIGHIVEVVGRIAEGCLRS